MEWLTAHPLVKAAGDSWRLATEHPWLEAVREDRLPDALFRNWLLQTIRLTEAQIRAQARTIETTGRPIQKVLIGGLSLLSGQLDWFEKIASQILLDLRIGPMPACRAYGACLEQIARQAEPEEQWSMHFAVEAARLASWSSLEPAGPLYDFIRRWSSPAYIVYVQGLSDAANKGPLESASRSFRAVLEQQRLFWDACWDPHLGSRSSGA